MAPNNYKLVNVSCNIIERLSRPNIGLVIHQQRPDMLALLARINFVTESETKNSYLVTDGTNYYGEGLQVIQWKSNIEGFNDLPDACPGHIYHIYGQVRYYQNQLSLVVFKFVEMADLNELTLHLLSVINDSLLLKEIKQKATRSKDIPILKSLKNCDEADMDLEPDCTDEDTMSADMQCVLYLIKSDHSKDGLSVQDIALKMGQIDMKILYDCLTNLLNEGHIFNTCDGNHFKSSE